MRWRAIVLLTALLCMYLPKAAAQVEAVSWSLQLVTLSHPVREGSSLNVELIATIAPGWHIYSMTQLAGGPTPTHIIVTRQQSFELNGKILAPVPQKTQDSTFEMETESYEGRQTFRIPLLVASSAGGTHPTLLIDVHYQACSATVCMQPKTVHLAKVLDIESPPTKQGR